MTVEERAELVADLAGLRRDLERNSVFDESGPWEGNRRNRERIRLVLERGVRGCVLLLKETT